MKQFLLDNTTNEIGGIYWNHQKGSSQSVCLG